MEEATVAVTATEFHTFKIQKGEGFTTQMRSRTFSATIIFGILRKFYAAIFTVHSNPKLSLSLIIFSGFNFIPKVRTFRNMKRTDSAFAYCDFFHPT